MGLRLHVQRLTTKLTTYRLDSVGPYQTFQQQKA